MTTAARQGERARRHCVDEQEFGPCAICGAGEPPACVSCAGGRASLCAFASAESWGSAILERLTAIAVQRAGVRRGDIIKLDWPRVGGEFIFDGRRVAHLHYDAAEDIGHGCVPPEYRVPTEFPAGYWIGALECHWYEWLDTEALRMRLHARFGEPPGVRHPGRHTRGVVHAPFEHEGAAYCLILDAPPARVSAASASYVAALDDAIARHAALLVTAEPSELEPVEAPVAPHLWYHRQAG